MRRWVAMLGVLVWHLAGPGAGHAAARLKCSVHPPKSVKGKALQPLAKVSVDAAEKAALAGFEAAAHPEVAERELEAEHGCLVYSFDLRVAGEPGITEVLVDAGTGEVLSRTHETAAQESAEKAKDGKRHSGH